MMKISRMKTIFNINFTIKYKTTNNLSELEPQKIFKRQTEATSDLQPEYTQHRNSVQAHDCANLAVKVRKLHINK